MDVVRARPGRAGSIPLRLLAALVVACFAAYAAIALLRPRSVAPVVERATVVTDVVRRGTLVRSVSAPGAFVPARIAIVAAPSDGIVTEVLVRAGTHVAAGSPIARLRNADLEAELADLDAQVAAASAQAQAIEEEAQAAELQHRTALRAARGDREEAATQLSSNTQLHDQGLIADVPFRVARIKASSAQDRERLEAAAVNVAIADGRARLAAQRAVVEGLVARRSAKAAQLAGLVVIAGESGVVQSVSALAGSHVTTGSELARVAGDRDLEAVLQVPETDARLIRPGLRVRLDSGSEPLAGIVSRVEPAAQAGSVPVHVTIGGSTAAARPQMHVDGAIELGRIPNAMSIVRPAGAADDAVVSLYRIEPDGRSADRVRVALGRGAAERVEVRSGLVPGNTVIVSDVGSVAGDVPRITLR